jgi:hypothetical protein
VWFEEQTQASWNRPGSHGHGVSGLVNRLVAAWEHYFEMRSARKVFDWLGPERLKHFVNADANREVRSPRNATKYSLNSRQRED